MTVDPFAHSDAAYALGALDGAERAAYEAHLPTCAACQARVAEARSTLAFLGAVEPADLERADEAPPDTLLPGLLRRARRERSRRRAVTTSIAAVAAACLVALAVVLWPDSKAAAPPPPQALSAVRTSQVSATAALTTRRWGTQIDVRCRYAHDQGFAGAYDLRVIDKDGSAHAAGSWTQIGDRTVEFTGGTEVRRDRIAKVQITLTDGTPILQLRL